MALSPDLLEILVCPEAYSPVKLADAALLKRVNDAIAAGKVKNKAGQPVAEALQAGLVREDGLVLYPVRDDIPIMLADEAIVLAEVS